MTLLVLSIVFFLVGVWLPTVLGSKKHLLERFELRRVRVGALVDRRVEIVRRHERAGEDAAVAAEVVRQPVAQDASRVLEQPKLQGHHQVVGEHLLKTMTCPQHDIAGVLRRMQPRYHDIVAAYH